MGGEGGRSSRGNSAHPKPQQQGGPLRKDPGRPSGWRRQWVCSSVGRDSVVAPRITVQTYW